jgi:hypothetical protein
LVLSEYLKYLAAKVRMHFDAFAETSELLTPANKAATAAWSLIRKSGNRFSEKIMLQRKLDLDPIQVDRIKV